MVPEGKNKLGYYFSSSRKKGFDGLPLLSVTLHNGLVRRDGLERRTETNITPEEHLLVRRGDIAYNMMRIWQGALGRADCDGMVSPAYVILRPNKYIDSKFAEYLFNTPRIIYLFWAYSYGLTKDRLRLYFNDFKSIPVEIPPLPEQTKIAKILSAWDRSIDVTEKLLKNSQQQKKSLMQQLLTGKKRIPGFSGEWKTKTLSELGEIKSAGVDKKIIDGEKPIRLLNFTDVFNRSFIYSHQLNHWVTAPESKISGCDVRIGDVFFTPSSETRDEAGIPAVAAENIDKCCYSYHVVRLRFTEKWDLNFKAYVFTTSQFRRQAYMLADGSGQRYVISQDNFRKIQVTFPCYEEQTAIGKVLKAAESEIEILEQKLSCLRQEKKALMQQLLTGKRRVKLNDDLHGEVA